MKTREITFAEITAEEFETSVREEILIHFGLDPQILGRAARDQIAENLHPDWFFRFFRGGDTIRVERRRSFMVFCRFLRGGLQMMEGVLASVSMLSSAQYDLLTERVGKDEIEALTVLEIDEKYRILLNDSGDRIEVALRTNQ